MPCAILRALAALLLLSAKLASAQQSLQTTTTTTLYSTTTVLTSTITITGDHSTSVSVTTETIATAIPAATGTMAYTGDVFQSAVLNSTNYYRAQHQAGSLSWDDSLAQYAQDYAEKCQWKHSDGPNGENLAEGYPSPALSIDAWANEEKHYNYAKPRFHESTGHFTQLVWKNTTSVGCGAVQCASDAEDGVKGWFLVCEYSPAGNVDGEFREQVGKSGEGKDGRPGFGTGARNGGSVRLLGALVASCVLLAMFV